MSIQPVGVCVYVDVYTVYEMFVYTVDIDIDIDACEYNGCVFSAFASAL
jgi:hypothetical protein